MSAFIQPIRHPLATETKLIESINYMYGRHNRVGMTYLCIRWNKSLVEVEKIIRGRKFPRRIKGLSKTEKLVGYWTPESVHEFEQANGLEVVNP